MADQNQQSVADVLAVITAGGPLLVKSTDGKVSDEQYRAMTPAQRLEYARSFDQKQFQPDYGRR